MAFNCVLHRACSPNLNQFIRVFLLILVPFFVLSFFVQRCAYPSTPNQTLGTRGVTIVVASGDDGVANYPARGNASACGFFPSYPASSPFVVSVGATQVRIPKTKHTKK